MTNSPFRPAPLRVAHLSPKQPNGFDYAPDANIRAAIAADLDLLDLPRMRFTGEIQAHGRDAWALTGRLIARVVQPCAVTLAPVRTQIDEQVHRIFTPHLTTPDEEEAEMPDDALEPLGAFIDPAAVAYEALALALPLSPRAGGATLPEPEPDPDRDTRKPFAGLDKLLSGDKD